MLSNPISEAISVTTTIITRLFRSVQTPSSQLVNPNLFKCSFCAIKRTYYSFLLITEYNIDLRLLHSFVYLTRHCKQIGFDGKFNKHTCQILCCVCFIGTTCCLFSEFLACNISNLVRNIYMI